MNQLTEWQRSMDAIVIDLFREHGVTADHSIHEMKGGEPSEQCIVKVCNELPMKLWIYHAGVQIDIGKHSAHFEEGTYEDPNELKPDVESALEEFLIRWKKGTLPQRWFK